MPVYDDVRSTKELGADVIPFQIDHIRPGVTTLHEVVKICSAAFFNQKIMFCELNPLVLV